jgi:hypothetical protein
MRALTGTPDRQAPGKDTARPFSREPRGSPGGDGTVREPGPRQEVRGRVAKCTRRTVVVKVVASVSAVN